MREEDFLQQLQECPNDDSLRVVYADWLDDLGDVRGEFLRVAITLSRTPSDFDRVKLETRFQQLRPLIANQWLFWACRSMVEDEVRAVVFKDMISNGCSPGFGHNRPLFEAETRPFLQINDGKDPSWYVLALLVQDFELNCEGILARPISDREKYAGKQSPMFDKMVGYGVIHRIDQIHWDAEHTCTVEVSRFLEGLGSARNLYQVVFDKKWLIQDLSDQ